jgi:23S rRNA G2445 N2-methylase RlmL
MKIIQIIKDGNKLLGLGDDGYTYVYSKIKYLSWNPIKEKDNICSTNMWRRVADRDYELGMGVNYYDDEKDIFNKNEEHEWEDIITDDFNKISTELNDMFKEYR